MKEGILLKSKRVLQRCASCDEFLTMEFYRYKGKINRKIVRCKICNTASWINNKTHREIRRAKGIEELLAKKKKE